MRTRWIPVTLAILALLALYGCAGMAYTEPAVGDAPPPPDDVDVSYFYDALAPYGNWVWDDAYGWVWYPTDVPVDWRPYTDGEWVWTDDGWTWMSDWDWGWACFHYGRWFDHPDYGWCWVPGQVWSPAWVAWREGDGWIGWCPLPPEVGWEVGIGFQWNDWDDMPGVRHHWWSFCRESEFPDRDIGHRLAPRHRAVVLLKDTRNITDYGFQDSHVVNRSFDVQRIRAAYGHDIPPYRVADLTTPPAHANRVLSRDTFYAYRPPVAKAPEGRAPRLVKTPRNVPTPVPVVPPNARAPEVNRSDREQMRRQRLDLEKRQASERKRLEQEQRQEIQQPPPGLSAEDLRRQQQEEQRAFDEQMTREQRVLQSREQQQQQQQQEQRQRIERTAPAGKQPPAKSPPPPATKERKEKQERPDRGK